MTKPLLLIAPLALFLTALPRARGESATTPTIVAAPFVTNSGEEFRWIGRALAESLNERLLATPELNALSLRQVHAAAQANDIPLEQLQDEEEARRLARQLGADLIVVGRYEAKWPAVRLLFRVVRRVPGPTVEGSLEGAISALPTLEQDLADAVYPAAKLESPPPPRKGTRNVEAWREAMVGFALLDWQSLSPLHTGAKRPSTLPEETLAAVKKHFATARKLDPSYGAAAAGLALVEALEGHKNAAYRALEAAKRHAPHSSETLLASYFLALRLDSAAQARAELRAAIDAHPGFLHGRGYLAELLLAQLDYKGAREVLDAYLNRAPRQPWALAQRGYAHGKLGQHTAAIADTIAAISALPESPSLLIELASRYIDAGKLTGAEDALRHAVERYPEEGRAYVRLCYVYLLQQQDEAAIAMCEKSLQLATSAKRAKDRAYAHLNLGQAYGRKGQKDKAFEHLQEAVATGLVSLGALERDPALGELRSDPRFDALRTPGKSRKNAQ